MFRFGRVQENADWFWPVVVALLLAWYVVRRYRKDAADLRPGLRVFLCALRLLVVAGLLVVYLHPRWERFVGSSRVAILIDTSASMSNRDILPGVPVEGAVVGDPERPTLGPSRLEALTDWIARADLIDRLREKHDVVVYRFDRNTERILLETQTDSQGTSTVLKKERDTPSPLGGNISSGSTSDASRDAATGEPQLLNGFPAEGDQTRLGEALLEVIQRERGEPLSGIVLLSDGGQNAGASIDAALETAGRTLIPIYTVGIGALHRPLNFRVLSIDAAERAFPNDPFTVRAQVELIGGETASSGTDATGKWKLPVRLDMKSVALSDGTAPPPASPALSAGTDTGPDAGRDSAPVAHIGEKVVEIAPGGVVSVDFEVRGEQTGLQRLIVRIEPPPGDTNAGDDAVETEIEIVDRKDRVLLYAGGPGRDYQFLLSQIFRDKTMQVDVYIPWARQGISQSADAVLDFFPATITEMAKYDCVVAFDPNWSELSQEEINALEHWVARQGGGLVTVAGPVFAADPLLGWTSDSRLLKIKALYPIEFSARGATEQRYISQSAPMPLRFTRAGEEAEFLRPSDGDADSRAIWSEFPGFYGFLGVKGIKPTATLLASLAAEGAETIPDPATAGAATGGSGNVNPRSAFFVEQFYGAGHVLYIGGAEIWRLRRLDPVYFEKIYTKIIRHVSQGRLRRQSDLGTLSSDKRRYALGSIAAIRATATDAQLQPLTLPALSLDVISPDGKRKTLRLTLDPNVPGSYLGHLPLTEEGDWNLALQPAGSTERFTRKLQVRMSDLERENISRNEPLLKTIAEKTGGRYFSSPGIAQAPRRESPLYGPLFLNDRTATPSPSGTSNPGITTTEFPPELTGLLKVRSQRTVADVETERQTATVLLSILAALLLFEWLTRRFARLA